MRDFEAWLESNGRSPAEMAPEVPAARDSEEVAIYEKLTAPEPCPVQVIGP
jgi:hypothetical protein